MKPHFIAYLLLTLSACGQPQVKYKKFSSSSTVDTTLNPTRSMLDYSPTMDKAHPIAKLLMSDAFYWSPIEETAPFGSDDGADTYAGFADWRDTHKSDNPKVFLYEQIESWRYPIFDLNETIFDKLKPYLKQNDLGTRFMSGIDAAITAIAFGQLYLEGTVNKEFNVLAKSSIKRELIPEMLNLWGDSFKVTREIQLKKMLYVLNQVDLIR